MSLTHKSESLREFMRALSESPGDGSFSVVDHWDADLSAVGIANPLNSGILTYVRVNDQSPRYFISLEHLPVGELADHPYTPGSEYSVDSFDEAAALIRRHVVEQGDG